MQWLEENERRPELFNYFEIVFPVQDDEVLIGTTEWEFKLGMGITKGFNWGTLTVRGAAEYSEEENRTQLGEVAIEYLKRLSLGWRVFLGVEGTQDEAECIPEAQWHINDHIIIKLNSGFGITSKAADWASEVGVMFRI
jgi:hypothetical protein